MSSKINVLWVIDHVCYDGSLHGGGRLYWNLVPQFDSERFNVIPCIMRATDEIREVFKNAPVPVRILDKGKYDVTTLWTLIRLIRQENIHVMHLHCYGASIFGRIASVITGVPCIIHDYDTAIYFPYPPYLWLADRMLRGVAKRAIAASPMVKDYFINRRRVPANKINMAFHAIPPRKFAPVSAERTAQVRKSLGIEDGKMVVGTVTKLGPERGNKFLLRTAANVLGRADNAVFVVVYKPTVFHRAPDERYIDVSKIEDEDRIEALKELAAELGIQDRVLFVEEDQNNVDDLTGAFDLFVAPFLSLRFSSVNILEAMAMAKPVIATDIGEQQEIIENGRNGYLVPVGEVQAFADRIVEVISNPGEMRRMSNQARTMSHQYSAEGYINKLQDWYTEMALGSRKAKALKLGETN